MAQNGGYYVCSLPHAAKIRNKGEYNAYPVTIVPTVDIGEMMLRCMDNLIYTDTFGYHLNGSYRPGEPFTITFDPIKTVETCVYYKLKDTENLSRIYKSAFQSESTNTTIEFSDGKWEWKNNEGALINKGEYQESSEYKGLIALTTTSDSLAGNTNSYKTMMPLMFYLSGDQIYYPCFIKED